MGHRKGDNCPIMSRNLVNASRTLELTPTGSVAVYTQAYQNVQMAFVALETELGGVRSSVPNSNAYLDRYVRLLGSLAGAAAQPAPLPPQILSDRRYRPAGWMSGYTTTSCAQYGLVERHAAVVVLAAEHDQPERVLPAIAPGRRVLLRASRCVESCPARGNAGGRGAVQRAEAACAGRRHHADAASEHAAGTRLSSVGMS